MTKPRGAFTGAWLNEHLPDGLAVQIRTYCGETDPAPMLAVLAREKSLWQFNVRRAHEDAEPAQWHLMLAAVRTALAENPEEGASQIAKLPARVRAEIDTLLVQGTGTGWAGLLREARTDPEASGPALVLAALCLVEDAARVLRGKRGRSVRRDVGSALRAVTQAVCKSSSLSWSRARELAAELMRECGMPAPEGRSQLVLLAPEPGRGKLPDIT